MKVVLILITLSISIRLWPHGSEDHTKMKTFISKGSLSSEVTDEKYILINKTYTSKVKPIFERSCFSCHSSETKYPWYYKIVGVKQLINSHILDAKKHLDMSEGFPFKSHETPLMDLRSISNVIEDKSMPPFLFRMMHFESRLTKKEIKEIREWVKKSKELLK